MPRLPVFALFLLSCLACHSGATAAASPEAAGAVSSLDAENPYTETARAEATRQAAPGARPDPAARASRPQAGWSDDAESAEDRAGRVAGWLVLGSMGAAAAYGLIFLGALLLAPHGC